MSNYYLQREFGEYQCKYCKLHFYNAYTKSYHERFNCKSKPTDPLRQGIPFAKLTRYIGNKRKQKLRVLR